MKLYFCRSFFNSHNRMISYGWEMMFSDIISCVCSFCLFLVVVITLLALRDVMCQTTLLQWLPLMNANTLHTKLFTASILKTLKGLFFLWTLCQQKSNVYKMLHIFEFYYASQTGIEVWYVWGFFCHREGKKALLVFGITAWPPQA